MHPDWIVEHLRVRIDRKSAETLSRQLYRLLREAIRSARLRSGAALPATRQLASALALGRNTVLAAYDQLLAEGYLDSKQGSGTFVSSIFEHHRAQQTPPRAHASLSRRGEALAAVSKLPVGLYGAFAPGMPEIRQFPHELWQRLQQQHARSSPPDWWHYQQEGGLRQLREAIADYAQLSRSVRCGADQVLVLQGAQQAMELTARLLADQGDTAWMEDPGYSGAQAAFMAAGMDITPVSVDEQGLNPQAAPAGSQPRLIYITPSHQYPSGVVMTLERRLQLLQLAEEKDCWIMEDDYDSEFRYDTQPLASLQGLASSERVIYLGTFSKVMYPALRLAYLIVPEALVDSFRSAYARLYREGGYALQSALAAFMEQGHFARHIRRMRELYRIRQQLLRHTLRQQLGDSLPLSSGEAGMHLVAKLPAHIDDDSLSRHAAEQGLWLRPLSRHYLGGHSQPGLVLGYAGVDDADIPESSRKLARLLERHQP